MTYTAWSFVISDSDTGRFAGVGLIAPDVPYCTVVWEGLDYFDRRQSRSWKMLKEQIRAGFGPQLVPRWSAIYDVLTGEGSGAVNVQYVSKQPIAVENRYQILDALDRLLESKVRAYDSRGRYR